MLVKCHNCGNSNTAESNFCRFCGTRFQASPPPAPAPDPFGFRPPQPYSWKTDEFQTQNEARTTLPHATSPILPPGTGPVVGQAQGVGFYTGAPVDHQYRCPHCGTNFLPRMERRVSTAGWIVFSVLLVFTFIFFWIGLLMKENVAICPMCKARVG